MHGLTTDTWWIDRKAIVGSIGVDWMRWRCLRYCDSCDCWMMDSDTVNHSLCFFSLALEASIQAYAVTISHDFSSKFCLDVRPGVQLQSLGSSMIIELRINRLRSLFITFGAFALLPGVFFLASFTRIAVV